MKNAEIILYQPDDQSVRIKVRMDKETVWLTQSQMVDLFASTKQNISLHIENIFREGELSPGSTVKEFLTVQMEGRRKVGERFMNNLVLRRQSLNQGTGKGSSCNPQHSVSRFITDFCRHELRLVIEVGRVYHASADQPENDIIRSFVFIMFAIRKLLFTFV